jgi:hypothetical protein
VATKTLSVLSSASYERTDGRAFGHERTRPCGFPGRWVNTFLGLHLLDRLCGTLLACILGCLNGMQSEPNGTFSSHMSPSVCMYSAVLRAAADGRGEGTTQHGMGISGIYSTAIHL